MSSTLHTQLKKVALLCIATTTLTHSCSKPETADVDPREFILKSWSNNLILPEYQTFSESTETLQTHVTSLCAEKTEANLEQAQQSWKTSRTHWKRTEIFAFGPYADFPDRFGTQLDFWPARPETIETTLAELGADIDAQTLSTLGAASRGLPAVEYFLFATPQEDAATIATQDEILQHLNSDPNICIYLTAAAEDVHNQAVGIYQAWSPEHGDYYGKVVNPESYEDNMFMDRTESLSEVVNRMAFTIDNIRRDKLGKPAGESTGAPSLESMESRYSQHALADIRANLEMILWLFEGNEDITDPDAYWLKDHPRLFVRQDLIDDFYANYEQVITDLDALEPSLEASINDDPQKALKAIDSLGELQKTIQVDIINALSLTRSFNDSDGD